MRYATRIFGASASLALLGSCSALGGADRVAGPQSASNIGSPLASVSDDPIVIGAPFMVGSVKYTPQDVPNYDEVGYTSHYGIEMAGRTTANGEIFVPQSITAAHKTLALPSYVEVTALETGRTILVRVNDRGPFANDHLLELSEGAARQLGIAGQGASGVRVRKVNPPDQERAVLRQGMSAAERIATPEPLLRVLRDNLAKLPKPSALVSGGAPIQEPSSSDKPSTPAIADKHLIRDGNENKRASAIVPPALRGAGTSAGFVVQVGAFSSRARADNLARKIGASVQASTDGKFYRVRYGPFESEAEAQKSLMAAKKRGYSQARLYRD